jgi:hypothetical protein
VASLSIEERLLHYFLAMGAQQDPSTLSAPHALTFTLGSDKVHVAILKHDAFLQRGSILEAVLSLVELRNSANQVYLAAPRLLGTTTDADVFRSKGIGLILYDDRKIEETVQPKSVHNAQPEQVSERTDTLLVTEVATLKSMCLEMERTITRLREEFQNLQSKTSSKPLPRVPDSTFQPKSSMFDHTSKFVETSDELPSFFINNPWLEVLSRRGREETATIAG